MCDQIRSGSCLHCSHGIGIPKHTGRYCLHAAHMGAALQGCPHPVYTDRFLCLITNHKIFLSSLVSLLYAFKHLHHKIRNWYFSVFTACQLFQVIYPFVLRAGSFHCHKITDIQNLLLKIHIFPPEGCRFTQGNPCIKHQLESQSQRIAIFILIRDKYRFQLPDLFRLKP